LSLSWARSIQSMPPHPTAWRSISVLSSHLSLGLPSRLLPSGFPTKTLYTPLLSSMPAICPAHLIFSRFDNPNNIGWGVQIIKLIIMKFFSTPVTSSLLGPNILLNTLFSNTLSHQCERPSFTPIQNNTLCWQLCFNPLNPELNLICYLLALLAHHFLHVSRIRVKSLTIRLLMSYIYGAPILDVSRSHTTTHHSR